MGDGPRGTPTIAGETVYVYTGEGILAAAAFADGKLLWSHDVVSELKGKPAEYGMACSPLVVSGQVIVTAGAPGATVAAYEAASGKLAWTAGDDPAGYSSPALLKVGGREQIVVFSGGAALGLAPSKGTLLWRYEYTTNFECNIATPIAIGGRVFLSAGENHGSVLLELKPAGEKFEPAVVWESQGTTSVLRTEWQTAILQGDYLYGFDNVGGAGPISHLTCIKAATGERVWQKQRYGKGNFIAADGKLFIITFDGQLVLAKISSADYEELGRAPLVGRSAGVWTGDGRRLAGRSIRMRPYGGDIAIRPADLGQRARGPDGASRAARGGEWRSPWDRCRVAAAGAVCRRVPE